MEKVIAKSKRVQLLEEVFGIKLPEFKIHTSSRSIKSEAIEENGVLMASEWNHIPGCLPLPSELEIYLPKEGMTPRQVIAQLEVCSSVARGGSNDSYQLYSQAVMMAFHFTAIKNSIYLASLDYENWTLGQNVIEDETFLSPLRKEIQIFSEAFSRERPIKLSKEMKHLFLRLLLENNAHLNKGVEMGPEEGRKNIFYNTVNELLFVGFRGDHWGQDRNNPSEYVDYFLGHKCYDITEQLLQLKD